MTQPLLCIGGPKDGQRVAIESGHQLRVAVNDPNSPHAFRQTSYREEQIGTDQGRLSVWVHEDVSVHRAMELLIKHYTP